mmetsp:Transcript_79178/g.198954  ORF Transcript_79178/g.198954 Transcript_79178/m.198954 type:complete len:333 (+) Transcript_79178:431-1429(+)
MVVLVTHLPRSSLGSTSSILRKRWAMHELRRKMSDGIADRCVEALETSLGEGLLRSAAPIEVGVVRMYMACGNELIRCLAYDSNLHHLQAPAVERTEKPDRISGVGRQVTLQDGGAARKTGVRRDDHPRSTDPLRPDRDIDEHVGARETGRGECGRHQARLVVVGVVSRSDELIRCLACDFDFRHLHVGAVDDANYPDSIKRSHVQLQSDRHRCAVPDITNKLGVGRDDLPRSFDEPCLQGDPVLAVPMLSAPASSGTTFLERRLLFAPSVRRLLPRLDVPIRGLACDSDLHKLDCSPMNAIVHDPKKPIGCGRTCVESQRDRYRNTFPLDV